MGEFGLGIEVSMSLNTESEVGGKTNQVPSGGFASISHLPVGSEDEENFWLGRHCGL